MDYAARTARLLLGATAHPGGTALTRHLLAVAALAPRSRVLDVACGGGTTLGLLAQAGHRPLGVDVEPRAVRRACHRAPAVLADAHALPLITASLDAVVCECSVSTFADPTRALAEVARVLRPGGTFAMSDIRLDRNRADARVVAALDLLTTARADYAGLCEDAGLRVTHSEDRPQDARALTRRVRRRLAAVGARHAASTARACERAIDDGSLGYGLLIARRASTPATG